MKEDFLHYLWQCQYFDKTALNSTQGEVLQIFKSGIYNTDAGPDFIEAKIKIGKVLWVGSVEMHLRSSDWLRHKHEQDMLYENVVLHVVWQHDRDVLRKDGTKIPVLELRNRVDQKLLKRYQDFLLIDKELPCTNFFHKVPLVSKYSMLDKVMSERMQEKSTHVLQLYQSNKGDWEETAYQLLARNFGFKINADSFSRLAELLPLKVLKKHFDSIFQLEALLFGQAGLLEENSQDSYFLKLQKEYHFLSTKYTLKKNVMNKSEWKFFRVRPSNFPTIRIAQFAALISKSPMLFSLMINMKKTQNIYSQLKVEQSDYWKIHYMFGKLSDSKIGTMGMDSMRNIVLNTIIPLLYAYGQESNQPKMQSKALLLLENFMPEKNKIITILEGVGFEIKNAFDAQAGIGLYSNYCKQKKCLSCNIGSVILKE